MQSNQVEQSRSVLFDDGVERKYIPLAHKVYSAKSDMNAAQKMKFVHKGAGQESSRDVALSLKPPVFPFDDNEDNCVVFVCESSLTIIEATTEVPFTSMWRLLLAKSFLEAGRKLRLVLDFRHHILLQSFIVGVISIAGLNFIRSDLCNDLFFIVYC